MTYSKGNANTILSKKHYIEVRVLCISWKEDYTNKIPKKMLYLIFLNLTLHNFIENVQNIHP